MSWLDDLLGQEYNPYPAQVNPPNFYDYRPEMYQQEYDPFQLPDWLSTLPNVGRGAGEIFRAIQEPVYTASNYYAGLPEALNPNVPPTPISELGGGSLRDLAEQGELAKLLFPQLAFGYDTERTKVTNPYVLTAIEKIGGETLDELADPTNIPGALVGAGGLVGRGASTLDKMFAGMGAVSGLGEGLPALGSGIADISSQGINPNNFGQILEGLIGTGFGGLSAAGLAYSPSPSVSLPPEMISVQEPGPAPNTPEFDNNLARTLGAKVDLSSKDFETRASDADLMDSMLGKPSIPLENEQSFMEGLTNKLPFKYDPTKLGMGLGGFNFKYPNVETSGELGKYESPAIDPNIVYHGTPYDFEQFDLNKLGTGEGSQAFGSGFYFAENPSVANSYGINVGGNREGAPIQANLYAAEIPLPEQFLDYDKPIFQQPEELKVKVPGIQKALRYDDNLIKAVHDIEASLSGISELGIPTIGLEQGLRFFNANDPSGLPMLANAMHDISRTIAKGRYANADVNAAQIYNLNAALRDAWTSIKSSGEVSALLKDIPTGELLDLAGSDVKGVKYLDRGSRKVGKGTSNYVVFDPKDINILEKRRDDSIESLTTFVANVKSKYGDKNWRKEMSPEESAQFKELGMAVASSPVEVPIVEQPNVANIADQFKDSALKAEETLLKGNEIPPQIPPTIEPPKPNKPKPESVDITPLSKFERGAYTRERNIAKAAPVVGALERKYRQEHEIKASSAIADINEAVAGITKNQEDRIIRYMDGEQIVLTPKELTAANKLRTVTEQIATEARDEGVLKGYRKDYFTHVYEHTGTDTSPYFGPELTDKPYGKLEKTRTSKNTNIIRSFDILRQYADKAFRRISEAKYLGKDLAQVKRLKGDPATIKYIRDYFEEITGRKEAGGDVAKALTKTRYIAALGDLNYAALLQPSQITHTVAEVGIRRATKAAVKTLFDYKKSDLQALKDGALYPSISHEVGTAIADKGYMHGIPTVDRAMRVHANTAGRMLVEDAVKGDKFAIETLKGLGIVDLKDPKSIGLAGKLVSDKTQLRSDPSHLPGWFKTDAGKMAVQYLNFAYANTKYISEMLKHPNKNKAKIFRFALMGAAIGEGILDAKEAIKSLVPGPGEDERLLQRLIDSFNFDDMGKFDDKSISEKLAAIMKGKRIPWTSPAFRIIQNLALTAGGTIFTTLIDKIVSGQYGKLLLGPAGGLVSDLAEGARKDVSESFKRFNFEDMNFEDISPTGRNTSKKILENLPYATFLPTRKLAEEVFPKKKSGPSHPLFPKFPSVKFSPIA